MPRRLSHTAAKDPEHQFGDLYSLLCNEVWLRVAVHHVQQNKGSETAGIDGKTMANFRGNVDGYIEELKTTLKAETFEPCPVRRVYIPKPHSEKKRPLGVPILFDRIVQEALRMILEPIWEADLSVHSYGCRPNRSTYDAIAYMGNRLKGKGSRQENPRFTLEIPACRGDAQGTVCRNPDRHTPGWHREPPPGQPIPRCNGQVYGIQVPATLRIPTEQEKRTGKRQCPLRPLRR